MKVSVKGNVLTVVSDVAKEVVEKGYTDLKVRDKNDDVVFEIGLSKSTNAQISQFGFYGNTFVEGKLAATVILDINCKEEDVKKKYGEALIALKEHGAKIATEATEKEATIAGLFTQE